MFGRPKNKSLTYTPENIASELYNIINSVVSEINSSGTLNSEESGQLLFLVVALVFTTFEMALLTKAKTNKELTNRTNLEVWEYLHELVAESTGIDDKAFTQRVTKEYMAEIREGFRDNTPNKYSAFSITKTFSEVFIANLSDKFSLSDKNSRAAFNQASIASIAAYNLGSR